MSVTDVDREERADARNRPAWGQHNGSPLPADHPNDCPGSCCVREVA